jgi:PAS domain S-box-containing protein
MTDATGSLVAQSGPPERPEDRIEVAVPAEPAAVGRLRTAVREFAAGHGADSELLAGLSLAVSEAATNALMHAFVDREPGSIRLVARAGVGELVVNVSDDGRGMQPRTDSPGMGIGLPTIGQIASGLDIRERPGGGTDVRMTFAAPGVRGARAVAPGAQEEHTRLLAGVARLAQGAGWPAEGVDTLVDLLVPDVADACVVDVVGDAGVPRRLAARVAGDEELSRWLAARRPSSDSPAYAPLRTLAPHVLDITPAVMDTLEVEAGELDPLRGVDLAWWVGVPLREGDRAQGVLHLGMRAERGRPGEDDVAFFELLAEQATAGLATTRLVEELRRTRERLEHILGALAEAVTVHDAAGQTVYANEAAARLLGARDVEEVMAARPGDLAERFVITREDGSPVEVGDFPGRRLVEGREGAPLLTRSVHRATGEERWLLTKATLLDDDEGPLAVNIIEDVTDAKNAERRQRFLAQASELLVTAERTEETLQRLAELLVVDLADWCVIDLVAGDGATARRVALAHADPAKVSAAREIERRYPRSTAPGGALQALLEGGDPLLIAELTDEMLANHARDAEHLRMLEEVGLRSVMMVPLRAGGRTYGAITLISADSRRAFDDDDLAFAADVGRRAAAAMPAAARG